MLNTTAIFNRRSFAACVGDDESQETIAAILLRDLPAGSRFDFDLPEPGEDVGTLMIEHPQFDEFRRFDLGRGVAARGEMRVKTEGRGLGRTIMRNEIEFFRSYGFRKFEIEAGSEAGGYAWARMGFLPDDIWSDDFDLHTRSQVRHVYRRVRHLLSPPEAAQLDDAVELTCPEQMWDLADCKIDMTWRLRDEFAVSRGDRARYQVRTAIERTGMGKSIPTVAEYVTARIWHDLPMPLGRLLLAGTGWDGSLHFVNDAQMRRAGDYVGGWSWEQAGPAPAA